MQRLLSGSLIVCALALALPAAGPAEHPPVPVEKAAYHWPVFSNEQVSHNERAPGWKLALEPGQSVGPFTKSAPGLRVVFDGGEIAEIVPGQPDRGLALRLGDYYWQEPARHAAYATSARLASRSPSSN